MASSKDKSQKAIQILQSLKNANILTENIKNKASVISRGENFPTELSVNQEGIDSRLKHLSVATGHKFEYLTGQKTFLHYEHLQGNIENYIGMAMIPTGVIGPVRVIGSAANGDFYVPLSTSEGTLVASYHRGAKACYLAGGASSICLVEGVQRSPLFKFANLGELGEFMIWLFGEMEAFERITEETSRFARMVDMKPNIEGNHLTLTFEYHTGDAAGQNMVTLCTDAICNYIIANSPVRPAYWFIESNYSGDKKATALSFSNVRGKKVTTEITLPKEVVTQVLRTTPKQMAEYWQSSTVGAIQSGSIGAQGHYANGLTALFLATGQDVACIAEAAVGITRMQITDEGDLYASVTLPNLIVGTVGGGTGLPTQKECLELMGCYGTGHARKYAEICGAVVLAGELSIAAALSAGHFSAAHKKHGRKR